MLSSAWTALAGTVRHPRRTFSDVEERSSPGQDGALVLLGVCLVYTFILAAYLATGYRAASTSALGVPLSDQYRLQIWYQGPLFFVATGLCAGILLAVARATRRAATFGAVFGRLALATAVPFACTTMLVEAVTAVALLSGLVSPSGLLTWLTGSGAWFALLYQALGIAWLVALVILAVQSTSKGTWRSSAALGFAIVGVYTVPIALFIR